MYVYHTFACYDDMVTWLNTHNIKPEHIINIVKVDNWMCLVWVDSERQA